MMNVENRKKLDRLFNDDEGKDQERYQRSDDLNKKYEEFVVPIFAEYAEYFREKNLTVIQKNPTNLTINRNDTMFYIKCKKLADHIELSYSYNGAGLERNKTLSLEEINKNTIEDFFNQFVEYMLKES